MVKHTASILGVWVAKEGATESLATYQVEASATTRGLWAVGEGTARASSRRTLSKMALSLHWASISRSA